MPDPAHDLVLDDAQLVAAAAAGDAAAWGALVDRHAGVVWAVCRRFRLPESDAQDVSQTVWLRLVERLGSLRDPDAVGGWLATSTRNECIAVWRARRRQTPVDPETALDLFGADGTRSGPDAPDAPDAELLRAERRRLLAAAVEGLPPHCRRLLALLFADPPLPYDEIAARLDVSRGYIGPTRARCLGKLRDCPALMAYLMADAREAAHLPRVEPPLQPVVSSPSPLTSGTTPPASPRSLLGAAGPMELVAVANQLTCTGPRSNVDSAGPGQSS